MRKRQRCELVTLLDKPRLSLGDKLAIFRTIADLSERVERLERELARGQPR